MPTITIVNAMEKISRETYVRGYVDGALECLAIAADRRRLHRRSFTLETVTRDPEIQERALDALAVAYFGSDQPAYELASVLSEQVRSGQLDWHPDYWRKITERARQRLAVDEPILEMGLGNAAFLRQHGVEELTLQDIGDVRRPVRLAQSLNLLAVVLRRNLGMDPTGSDDTDE